MPHLAEQLARTPLAMFGGLIVLVVLGITGRAAAVEPLSHHPAQLHAAGAPGHPHPVITHDSTWAGVMVIVIIGGFFLPAAVIGPIARALLPEDEPQFTSHDEPADSSHHGH